jgi:hypothetical protein
MTMLYVRAKNRLTALLCSPVAYYIWALFVATGCQIPNNLFTDSSSSSQALQAYVSDSTGDGNIYQCSVNQETGMLSSCAVSNGGVSAWSPRKIILRSLGEGTVAYVADNGGDAVPGFYGNIYLCQVDAYNGALEFCAQSNGGISGWNPYTLGLSTQGQSTYAYVSGGDENVYQCLVDSSDGTLGNCQVSNGGYSDWIPSGLVFDTSTAGTLAFFADTNGETSGFGAVICSIDGFDGDLVSCAKANAGTGNEGFSDVALATIDRKSYSYLVDTDSVRVCEVGSSSDALSNCTSNTGGMTDWQPQSITVSTLGSNVFAYVSDGFRMYVCPLGTNGNLGTCEETEGDMPWRPTSIAIQ